jgi:uncharacterized membrane protein YphA (DoxX/SURF4 family)
VFARADPDNGVFSVLWPATLDKRQGVIVFEAFFREKMGPLALRLALGLVLVTHGFVKITAAGGMSWTQGLSTGWQLFIAWGELVSGVAILAGFRCRIFAALALGLTAGTFVWWQGWNIFHLPLRTLEPTAMLLLLSLALCCLGAGELSLDGRGRGLALKPARK